METLSLTLCNLQETMVALSLLDSDKQKVLLAWNVGGKTLIRVGRAPDNDIVLSHSLVSRYHLELQQSDRAERPAWHLTNLGKNGTLLNGILVSRGLVLDGAFIQLAPGGPVLKFELEHQAQPKLASVSDCTHAGNLPENLFCIYCGQPLRCEKMVRQYCVLQTLGRGGMGTTYLAWNEEKARGQKLSAILPQRADSSLLVLKELNADIAQIAKARELFEREARTLKSLDHPGVPKFYDFFVEGDRKYLAMELVRGQDLERRVYQQGPCTPKQAIEWMIQTCEVLQYLHSQKLPIVHRDIKPANLLVRTLDNRIVVIDFGAVKEIGTPAGTRIGAEGYSAPEQDLGRPVPQSDLYAIGPTLVFLLTGERPNKFYRQQNRSYRLHLEDIPTIAPKLRSVIERATQPKVRDRYQSAYQLSQALAECL